MKQKQNQAVEVCLVEMPFSAYCTPSFSLSILKACLNQAGLKSRVLYGSMRLAKLCGEADYLQILRYGKQTALLGEAVFSETLHLPLYHSFAEYLENMDTFMQAAGQRGKTALDLTEDKACAMRVQKLAEPFLQELAAEILALQPKIVAMADVFYQHNACLSLARCIKELSPETIVVLGGPNCSGVSGAAVVRHIPWVDYVCSGEADEYFAAFCSQLIREGNDLPELPYGVLTARSLEDGAGDCIPVRITRELDTIPLPDYTDYFCELERFALTERVHIALFYEFSRGCWWNERKPCTFCGLNGAVNVYRVKSERRILEDVRALREQYGIERIELTDNILSMEQINVLIPKLAGEGMTFFAEVKSNLTFEQLTKLRQSGFGILQPGVESLHDGVLQLMNKGNRAIRHVELLRNTIENGIMAVWHILAGFPGEDEQWYREMAEMIPHIRHIQPPRMFTNIIYTRHSEYQRYPEKYGLVLRPLETYYYVYPKLGDYVEATAYMLEPCDEMHRLYYPYIQQRGEAYKELMKVIVSWQISFAKNPDILRMRHLPEKAAVEVMDLRAGATTSFHHLTGAAAAAYIAARRVIRRDTLQQQLLSEYEKEEIDTAFAYLSSYHLWLELHGEVLSLAMEEKKMNRLDQQNWPMGLEKALLDAKSI